MMETRMLAAWGRRCAWAVPAMLALLAQPAGAGRLMLRIQAANPSGEPRTVDVRSSLPARVSTNDILNLAGLNLGYDVQSDTYYVHGQIELGPREIVVREVELDDIWVLDAAEIQALGDRSIRMVGELAATPYAAEASETSARVAREVEAILARQNENRISRVNPVRHIQAYETNLKALREVRRDVGQIENWMLASGLNPGDTLIGEDRHAAAPRRDAAVPVEFGEAVVKITVVNSSTAQSRKIQIRRELPKEVALEDVLDAGELDVRFDPVAKVTVIHADALEIGPMETRSFDVRIRDKWNVNAPRVAFLEKQLRALRVLIADRTGLTAVENTLDSVNRRLQVVASETGPDTLSPAYIAFYRRQSERLDDIERDLNRVDAALKPLDTRRGFDIPAPDKKTTWLVIYVILGFLALLSLLFFFRWFVKS